MSDNGRSQPSLPRRSVLTVIAVTALLFGAATFARWGELDKIRPTLASWHTAGSVVFASHWREEGPAALRFAMFWTPPSVEQPTLESRPVYTSFMSGSILPLYLLSTFSGLPPSVRMARGLGLLVQLLVAIVLGMVVLVCGRRLCPGTWWPVPSALAAAAVAIGAPSPYFEYIQGYFADQLELLPFVLFLWVESLRRAQATPRQRLRWDLIQALLLALGLATEWLFAFLAASALIVRLADGSFGRPGGRWLLRAVGYGAPVAMVGLLFLLQLYVLGTLGATGERFALRSGASAAARQGASVVSATESRFLPDLSARFWTFHLPNGFGPAALGLLSVCLLCVAGLMALLFARKLRGKPAGPGASTTARVLFLAVVPCLLYGLVFREHISNMFHVFAALKFTIPFALTVGLIPLVFGAAVLHWPARTRALGGAVVVLTAVATLVYLACLGDARQHLFDIAGPSDPPIAVSGPLVKEHTGYADIVVSPDFSVGSTDPISLMYARKMVHLVNSMGEVKAITEDVEGDYSVCLVTHADAVGSLQNGLAALASGPPVATQGGWSLWRVDKAAYTALVH